MLTHTNCIVCGHPTDGADLHAECLAHRLPQDAAVAFAALLITVLAPALVVWAS